MDEAGGVAQKMPSERSEGGCRDTLRCTLNRAGVL